MILKICGVCKILDYDTTLKDCRYCKLCGEWICHKDQNDVFRRGRAMLLKTLTKTH
jgi:hypothetical protein